MNSPSSDLSSPVSIDGGKKEAVGGEHTLGPWRLRVIDDTYHSIEAGCGFPHAKYQGFGLTGYVSLADARLIAAAPDMIVALQAEQEWREREAAGELNPEWDYERIVGDKRRAAIAKAKATGGAA